MLVASRGRNDGLRVTFVIVWKFRVGDAETTTFFGSCLDEGFEATEGRDGGRRRLMGMIGWIRAVSEVWSEHDTVIGSVVITEKGRNVEATRHDCERRE